MRFLASALITGLGLMFAAPMAAAAPQAMMLVAHGDSIKFLCTGEECLAEADGDMSAGRTRDSERWHAL